MNFLRQTKLTKEEWVQLEVPIQNENENLILNMICQGYLNPDIQVQTHLSLATYLKLGGKYEQEIYRVFLKKEIDKINKNDILQMSGICDTKESAGKLTLSKSEKIKLENSFKLLKDNTNENIIEYKILDELRKYTRLLRKKKTIENDKNSLLHFINIFILEREFKDKVNESLLRIMRVILEKSNTVSIQLVLKNITYLYEHNEIFNFKTHQLYEHQRQILTIFKNRQSNFVFYCAPTSSGKTLSPIALAQDYKVIFICASKHIGLSLAKSAFHVGKKIGFAFGCTNMENIRLNYNAISSYTKTKNGKKIYDHSDGTNVELMICDVLSYESAMNYMKKFHDINKMILFWDEPTIGLDVEDSHLHPIIQKNWAVNIIPNIIFSCATLPKETQINPIIESAKNKFEGLQFQYIESVDQVSNIRLYDINGRVVMPHRHFDEYSSLVSFLSFQGEKYYKFFDSNECAKFLLFLENECSHSYIKDNFQYLTDISLYNIKKAYVLALLDIGAENWNKVIEKYRTHVLKMTRDDSCEHVGIDVTTKHSCTLTNGPTLFVSDNVENICKYMLMKANLDRNTLTSIEKKIDKNRKMLKQLTQMKNDYEDKIEPYKDCENIMTNMRFPPEVLQLHNNIEKLQNELLTLSLDDKYKPNTRTHYKNWQLEQDLTYEDSDAFTSSLSDEDIKEIIELYNIKTLYKLMMMMGIGVFSNNIMKEDEVSNKSIVEDNNKYIETMKKLAEQKRLYLIIANSDYIYGTNYQFSHCYLSKDMKNLTQEKIIQCIGRVGRQEKNKHFSFRFRTQEHIDTFYGMVENSIEAENMNRLFF